MIEERQKNRKFIQMYEDQMDCLTELAGNNYPAYKLFQFFAKFMDGNNALIMSNQAIHEAMNISRSTINRRVKYLKDNGWISVLKSGTSNIYFINPEIYWKNYANKKEYCQFEATVILSASENYDYLNNPKAVNYYKQIDTSYLTKRNNNKTELNKLGAELNAM